MNFVNKEDRGWPAYLFGGRVRTSTVALILAFLVVWFVYEIYQPPAKPPPAPATQVVPPGFVPDPNYTWVPRTSVGQWSTTTTTTTSPTTSPTESTTPASTSAGTPAPGAPTATTTSVPGGSPPATPAPPGPPPSPTSSR